MGKDMVQVRASELFKGPHFDREIIVLCVRWYLRYKLSYRDWVQVMTECGVEPTHTTILRWAQRFVPEFEKRWPVLAAGTSWRCDETYLKRRAAGPISIEQAISRVER
jgi:transposase-like protein